MFTGIVESIGKIEKTATAGNNRSFWIKAPFSTQLSVDQSVAHDGACLTVEEIKGEMYKVTAIQETLNKTTLGTWETGKLVNLERCIKIDGRLDGHFVLGHVDAVAECIDKKSLDGSWEFRFQFDPAHGSLVIEKGSIALNGVSLTLFDVASNEFSVAIIPYTYNNTNLNDLKPGARVNIEFDVLGKYINRRLQLGIR